MTEDRKPQSADKYIIRFPDGMRDQIAEAAKKNGRSMNAEIILRLEHSFTPWKERPWEERMVIDIDRAMLKLLTKDEYRILLDRVKAAGGADTVNGYRATVVRSDEDLRPPIPAGPRLREPEDNLSQQESEKSALARQLALDVLRMTEKYLDKQVVLTIPPGSGKAGASMALLKALDTVQSIAEKDPNPPRTPKIPGKNSPKRGLGGAPKAEKPKKEKPVVTKKRVFVRDEEAGKIKLDHTSKKDDE